MSTPAKPIRRASLKRSLPFLLVGGLLYACASIGHPDGGPIDVTPPEFVGSQPEQRATQVTKRKLSLRFNEIIKLEKPGEKIVISPPQLQQPEIKAAGRDIRIHLLDSLQPNTTYSIDFGDAIVDNNEGNPLGQFTYTFSTGSQIDTLEVSGTVLNAADLEPIKGIMVGLHNNLSDTAFTKQPLLRVGRTDSRGRFSIRGIAPGSYRLYALADADQDVRFSQRSEVIAFADSLVVPHMDQRMRLDTSWVDSLSYDTVYERKYTHYLPDDLVLRAFKEENPTLSFNKAERLVPEKFSLYFRGRPAQLPTLEGLNFDHQDAWVLEHSLHRDTLHYWLKDSLLHQQDTLKIQFTYQQTDTLEQLVYRTDTLNLVSKKKWGVQAEEKKKRKRGESITLTKADTPLLNIKLNTPSPLDLYAPLAFEFDEPITSFDLSAIHLYQKVDTLWEEREHWDFEADSLTHRRFNLFHEWDAEAEYEIRIDSAAFYNLYNTPSAAMKRAFKTRSENDYFILHFDVSGLQGRPAFVQLLSNQDKVVRQRRVEEGRASFYFLAPGKYGARLVVDENQNDQWDTGLYAEHQQPEAVYYYPTLMEYKALWEIAQPWDILSTPLDKQKPDELKKQKPDDEKRKKDRERRLRERRR